MAELPKVNFGGSAFFVTGKETRMISEQGRMMDALWFKAKGLFKINFLFWMFCLILKPSMVFPLDYTYIDVFPPGWVAARATDVNDNGDVVGEGGVIINGTLRDRGFLYSRGTYTELLPLGWTKSYAFGIDDNGDVVGYGYDESGYIRRGFIYSGGAFLYLFSSGWGGGLAFFIKNNSEGGGGGV